MTVSNHAYLPLPDKGEFAIALTMVEGRERAQRKPRLSKLVPHTSRISEWRSLDYSLQRICNLIFQLSKLKVDKSTLSRFIKANDISSKSRYLICHSAPVTGEPYSVGRLSQRVTK